MSNRFFALTARWLVVCWLITAPLPTQAREVLLGRRTVDLELDTARVTVNIAASETAARLVSRPLAGAPAIDQDGASDVDEQDDALDVRYEDAKVIIRRPHGEEERARGADARPQMEITVWIADDQPLRLLGKDLELILRGERVDRREDDEDQPDGRDAPDGELGGEPGNDDPARDGEGTETPVHRQGTPTEPHDPNPPFAIEIGVSSSSVDMVGVSDAALALSASRLRAEATHGALTVVAEDGTESEILEHDGTLDLSASSSDSVVVSATGALDLDLTQANLLIREGNGSIMGKAQSALIVIEQWRGPTTIESTETTFELRDTASRTKLTGRTLRVTGEAGRGAIEIASKQGGQITLNDWVGRTTITQEGDGTFESSSSQGPLLLDLRDGMRATVTDASSLVQATLRDAEIEVAGAQVLKVNSERSVLRASQIRRLERIEAIATELRLDLREVQAIGPIQADGASVLQIDMREPCRVVVSGGASTDGGRGVSADRCFVDLASQVGRTFSAGSRRGKTSVIRIDLGQGGQLDVEGHSSP